MSKSQKIVSGLTHVDLGWKKTAEEMEEIFENFIIKLLDVCSCYPEFTHMLEQAYNYRRLKANRPDLFEKLLPYVRSGQLEFVTGLASTIENNTTCGESFVRNMQIGRRFIKDNFGVDVAQCAMIDTFGFPPQMPQVLKQFGYSNLLANRLGGIRPRDVMRAVGLDGSEILLAGSDCLANYVRPGHVSFRYFLGYEEQEKLFERAEKNKTELQMVIPYSENEVMPCRFVPEMIRQSNGEFRFGHLTEFFDALRSSGEEFPCEFADMNPEFTGTFSLRHKLKLVNRRAETLLLESEKIAALHGRDVRNATEELWWTMAYSQFHDILTGSHPTNVYMDCMHKLEQVCDQSIRIMEETLQTSDSDWTVWNGLPFSRTEYVHIPLPEGWKDIASATLDGSPVRILRDVDGNAVIAATLRPMAAHRLHIKEGERHHVAQAPAACLENEYVRIEFSDRNLIAKMILKSSGRVVMKDIGDLLVIQKDMGNFQIEQPVHSEINCLTGDFTHKIYSVEDADIAEIQGVLPGPVEEMIPYRITLALYKGDPAIHVSIKIDWNSEAARLRLKLRTAMQASVNEYEIPFGVTERTAYVPRFNARGEWPVYRFACVEEPSAHWGVALVNRGTVGVEAHDGTLYTTLLRAPATEYAGMVPDDTSSEHGVHEFNFMLLPYENGWRSSGVCELAQRFNNPPIVFGGTAAHAGDSIELKGDGIVLSAVLNTPDGDMAVRMYETFGQPVSAVLKTNASFDAWASDLNEKRSVSIPVRDQELSLDFKPFEIKTVLLKRHEN